MATFSEKLKELREARWLTQEKAAKRLGISRQALTNYEIGARTPSYDMAIQLCKFYSVPFDYFADPEDDISAEDVAERAKELGVNFTQLSAASGISYSILRKKSRLTKKILRQLMDTLNDFDFTVFPNYRKPIKEEEE